MDVTGGSRAVEGNAIRCALQTMDVQNMPSALPIILSLVVVVTTFLVWSWWTSEDEERKKRAQKKSEKAGSILEGLTERERQRRRQLEEEVEQIRQMKLKKQEEIEGLARVKEQEQVKVREQQEVDQRVADQKKLKEEEQKREVREAVKEAHRQGVLCSFTTARIDGDDGNDPEVLLRIKLTDSVGFPTRIHHIKGRLKSDYPGQPLENRQRILHRGQVVGDHTKLQDLFTEHEPKTSPLPFHVVVGDSTQESQSEEAPPQVETRQETKPERKRREILSSDPIRVTIKTAAVAEDATTLELQGGSNIAEVKAAFVSAAAPPGDAPQLVFGGKVLQDEETLMVLVSKCLDKRNITLHAAAAN